MVLLEKYIEYLKNNKSKKINDERTLIVSQLQDFLIDKNLTGTTDDIKEFFQSKSWSLVEFGKTHYCMEEYITFIMKECKEPEARVLANAINDFMQASYEQTARDYVKERQNNILLIPDDVKINPACRGELTDEEFTTAFRELQRLIINIYDDIYNAPFDWGYPDFYITGGYYNRVKDILFALFLYGECNNGILSVDGKMFFINTSVKRHKKIEKMIEGFTQKGFVFCGYDKKAVKFIVSYPENPHVIIVLNAYLKCAAIMPGNWLIGIFKDSLCYRLIEAPQKYEAVFLAKMDMSSEAIRQIQYYLYNEAAKYGYKIDVHEPIQQGCILYKKGNKSFLLVGETNVSGIPIERGMVSAKVTFRKAFNLAPKKFEALAKKFPTVLKSNCRGCTSFDKNCQWRICYEINGKTNYNCTYTSFVFRNLKLDDVKDILELFIIENKIRIV